ncbi:uncharacterized protein E0L32_010498 [Thyridium curvatum]|uniref:Uncharacterized protein n=1 Tax=Thyridium curvatum TaxID=1093900 RepID=A0A507ASC5_9PEZI|nr:uncharacterized protein E0L32_010498 [Thyridium curvatum]TPX07811.1 hypothetical protein E0L32_010498 [Thyridium curvatum]
MKPFFVLTFLASLGTALGTAVEVEKRDINAGAQPLSPRAAFRAATRSEIKARDFFECSSGPAPSDADCQTVVNNVLASNGNLLIADNSCVTYSAGTCTGFFCALCQTMATSTDFIANQLSSAEALCVAGGQAGTVVGDSAPQWSAGFVQSGQGLPNYNDIC